jgi:uncharacterized protein (DUF736 family)
MTDEEKKADWKNRELGALWKKKSSTGLEFYSGVVKINGEEIKLVCYANKDKKSDNQPDVRIYKEAPRNNQDNNGGFE